jgi:hypothetical protein
MPGLHTTGIRGLQAELPQENNLEKLASMRFHKRDMEVSEAIGIPDREWLS